LKVGITPVKPIDGLSGRWDDLLERARAWPVGGEEGGREGGKEGGKGGRGRTVAIGF